MKRSAASTRSEYTLARPNTAPNITKDNPAAKFLVSSRVATHSTLLSDQSDVKGRARRAAP